MYGQWGCRYKAKRNVQKAETKGIERERLIVCRKIKISGDDVSPGIKNFFHFKLKASELFDVPNGTFWTGFGQWAECTNRMDRTCRRNPTPRPDVESNLLYILRFLRVAIARHDWQAELSERGSRNSGEDRSWKFSFARSRRGVLAAARSVKRGTL